MAEADLERNWQGFRDERVAEALRAWWRELKEVRGERAQLRRCRELGEVFFTPAFHRLYRQLAPLGVADKEALALVAGLAAHVKEEPKDGPRGFAARLGAPDSPGGKPALSDLRFRRLLKSKGREELFPALVRTLALLDGVADLADLADAAYRWTWRHQRVQRDWAFDYYENLPNQ